MPQTSNRLTEGYMACPAALSYQNGAGGAGAGGACPSDDWGAEGATNASCAAEVYTLAGYVSRKRPLAQLAVAESYYAEAISRVEVCVRVRARMHACARAPRPSATTLCQHALPPLSYVHITTHPQQSIRLC